MTQIVEKANIEAYLRKDSFHKHLVERFKTYSDPTSQKFNSKIATDSIARIVLYDGKSLGWPEEACASLKRQLTDELIDKAIEYKRLQEESLKSAEKAQETYSRRLEKTRDAFISLIDTTELFYAEHALESLLALYKDKFNLPESELKDQELGWKSYLQDKHGKKPLSVIDDVIDIFTEYQNPDYEPIVPPVKTSSLPSVKTVSPEDFTYISDMEFNEKGRIVKDAEDRYPTQIIEIAKLPNLTKNITFGKTTYKFPLTTSESQIESYLSTNKQKKVFPSNWIEQPHRQKEVWTDEQLDSWAKEQLEQIKKEKERQKRIDDIKKRSEARQKKPLWKRVLFKEIF